MKALAPHAAEAGPITAARTVKRGTEKRYEWDDDIPCKPPRPSNDHRRLRGRGSERKTPVLALVERNGRVRAKPVERVTAEELKGAIRQHVDRSSSIHTDELASYKGIGAEFEGGHYVVRHTAGEYVAGEASTNTAESYFSLLKRAVHGAYHSVSKKHLGRYLDHQSFLWNTRDLSDGTRVEAAVRGTAGKRLAYKLPMSA